MSDDADDAAAPDFSDVLVIVPAHNEATVIFDVVSGLRKTFTHVLVVDDGSGDGTAQIAESAGAEVAKHLLNLGQGGALLTGFRIASQLPRIKWVVTFDADGQHRVSDAAAMVEEARSKDLEVVLGTRFGEGSSEASFAKRTLLKMATRYTRFSTGLKVTDTHNGLRVMTSSLAGRMVITDRGMGHASDILDYIAHHKVAWAEMPIHVHYTEYSRSKGQSMSNAVNLVTDRWLR